MGKKFKYSPGVMSKNISFEDFEILLKKRKEASKLNNVEPENNIKSDVFETESIKNIEEQSTEPQIEPETQSNIQEQENIIENKNQEQFVNDENQINNIEPENNIKSDTFETENIQNIEEQSTEPQIEPETQSNIQEQKNIIENTNQEQFINNENQKNIIENTNQEQFINNENQINNIASPVIDINAMLGNLDSKTLGTEMNNTVSEEKEPQQTQQIQDNYTNTNQNANLNNSQPNSSKKMIYWVIFGIIILLGIFYFYTTRPMLFDDIKNAFGGNGNSQNEVKTPIADEIANNSGKKENLKDEKSTKPKEKTDKKIESQSGEQSKIENKVEKQKENKDIIGEEIDKELGKENGGNNLEESGEKQGENELDNEKGQMEANKIILEDLSKDIEELLKLAIKAKNKKVIIQLNAIKNKIKEIIDGLENGKEIDLNVLNRSVSSLQSFSKKLEEKLK